MAFNGSGVFNRLYSWVTQAGLGQKIRSDQMDADTNDIATGLSNCITKDGQQTITANIPFNAKKITGLGDGTAAQDAVTYKQLNTVAPVYAGTSGGTANALTLTPTFILPAYAAGIAFNFLPSLTNTSGTVTVAVSSLATRNIKKSIGGAIVILAVGDIIANVPAEIIDDGTQYILLNPQFHTQGADIASASTTVLDSATGEYVNITGTTTITAITLAQGRAASVQFSDILTLTNGASLILPGGANITTAAGDTATFRGEASGVVRCTAYQRASGKSIFIGANLTTNTFTGAQIGSVTALTSTSNHIATDLSVNNNFSHTFTENTTLDNPSNVVAGQSGRIFFTQHASSPKTLAFGSFWLFAASENGGLDPTVTATNSAVDVLYYDVLSSTQISAHLSKGLA